MNVKLLDGGGFLIDIGKEQPVKGRFDMRAIENFCTKRGIPGIIILSEMFKTGMMPTHYADFILCAIHRTYSTPEHCEIKDDDVLGWIETMGGFSSPVFLKLMAQGMKLFVNIKNSASMIELTEEEKKILGMPIAGSASDSEQSAQD